MYIRPTNARKHAIACLYFAEEPTRATSKIISAIGVTSACVTDTSFDSRAARIRRPSEAVLVVVQLAILGAGQEREGRRRKYRT